MTLMLASIFNTNPEVIVVLIKNGSNVNARNKYGNTPLMLASFFNSNLEILEVLIKTGADVNARDENDSTVLDYAKDNENIYNTPIYWEMKELIDK